MNKLIAWFTGIILVILGALVAFVPFGNPVSEYLAAKNAEIYLEENYQNTDYFVDNVSYDFKTGNYYVHIKAPDSVDRSFTLYAGVMVISVPVISSLAFIKRFRLMYCFRRIPYLALNSRLK